MKLISIMIATIFVISTAIAGIATNNIHDPKTIYVDDDNTMGPWDGTIDHPFQFIQDGIDAADPGYTIFVYSGTYSENVVVNKTINLIGEDKNTTIIDGGYIGDVIHISKDWVNISGFSIKNSGNSEETLNNKIYIKSPYFFFAVL